MTDFDKDVRERKALVPSARRKKNGSKSKKCMLPSDNLTKGELRKMNGEVMTINLNKPYSYEELKKFPKTMQIEYVKHLKEKYCMSTWMFAEMAGCAQATAKHYFKDKLGFELAMKGKRATMEQRIAFAKFIGNNVIEEKNDVVEEKNDAVMPVIETKPIVKETNGLNCNKVAASPLVAKLAYHGTAREVCEALIFALGAESVGRFEIAFRRDNDA